MHFPREYGEYPMQHKRAEPEKMQLVPKDMFGNRPTALVADQKLPSTRNDYDSKFAKTNADGTRCTDYYYPKELQGWEKNCNCGILATDYCNPIEYQPLLPLSVDNRLFTSPYSSQNNVCSNAVAPYAKTTTGDFPLWLKIYSTASVECDHKLHWDMFNIKDLCFFDNVLIKLYELELEEIILWYKCYKNALLREMDKRLLEANQQRQMILLYNS